VSNHTFLSMPHTRCFALLFGLLFSAQSVYGQLERTLHHIQAVDSAGLISLQLPESYQCQLINWAGDNLLIETRVVVRHGSMPLVKDFIKNGRYDIVFEHKNDSLTVKPRMLKRPTVRLPNAKRAVEEDIEVKIFVPDMYDWTDDKRTLTLKKKA
jgi:hypothetical protein